MSKTLENKTALTAKQSGLYFRIRKNRKVNRVLNALLGLILIGLFAPLLANEKPLFMKYKGENFYPAFWDINPFMDKNFYHLTSKSGQQETLQLDITNWKNLNYESVIWCPVPYSAGKSDYANSNFVSPFGKQMYTETEVIQLRFRHFLGTGMRGEDVLAGLIQGTRISVSIGIISMLFASFIGFLFGALAGYFGDYDFKLSRAVVVCSLTGIALAWFYGFYVRAIELQNAFSVSVSETLVQLCIALLIFSSILFIFIQLGKLLSISTFGNKKISIPIDSIISRLMEIISSLPTFILIISIAAITKASLFNLIVILALTSWTSIARLTRAEVLRIKKLDYIQAAKALGYSQRRIIFKHALLNGTSPAVVAIAFGVASTILLESSLSFLGIGLPLETVSWGSMLSEGRGQFSAWWMTLFPGLAIFLTVTIYNLLGDRLREIR